MVVGGLFGSGWSFFWTSIRVNLFLLSICSLREPVCHRWKSFKPVFTNAIIAWRFPIWYLFLSVTLSELRCIFALGSYSSSSNSFHMLLIHSEFLLCSIRSHILLQNCFVSLSSSILLLLAGRIIFRCFEMSCFVCIVLSCLDTFFVFHLLPVPSDLFPRVFLFFVVFFFTCVAFFFLFQQTPAFFVCFIIFSCCRSFPVYVSSQISSLGFEILFVLFRGTPILSQINFVPA